MRTWPILIAHHLPEEGHRCVFAGPVPICRRCLATWPLMAAVLGAGMLGQLPLASPEELALWLAPPAGEYLAVHLGRAPYTPRRTWLFGALLGVGIGRALHRYVLDPSDLIAWMALGCAGLPMFAAGLYASYQRKVKKFEDV
ncbi:MAG: hypothetical protein H6741_14380 [Alphaproteobacteria bacterium]|nr:hypothetical protein [Alphaproteobacteria bacterium]MCB9793903.1 hypothetical protein [Alphaproteobacteria bacterium]